MESKKIALLAVAIVAIGIFALPGTVSLFSGQHTWYDLSPAYGGQTGWGGNDVPCEKCHAEIADEMGTAENGAHRNLTCAMCHRAAPFTGYTYARGNYTYAAKWQGTKPGKEAHAASVVECMDCHATDLAHQSEPEYAYIDDCKKCHGESFVFDFITAGGFGLTGKGWDTGTVAAHKKFVLDAIDEPLMEGANEACLACHTRIGVNITWTKKVYLDFTATEDAAGNWTIPSFTAGGENVTQVNTSNEWVK